MNEATIRQFLKQVEKELNGNILPFWLTHLRDGKNGGFVGWMSNDLVVDEKAPKGLILHTRLLWTFSALARFLGDSRCEAMAHDAFEVLRRDFWDERYGGAYWQVGAEGPLRVQKKTYGQAFLIYGLAEYYRLTQTSKALAMAMEVFERLEKQALDEEYGGYWEVMERDWTLAAKQQLSEGDLVAPKSMNAHLHLLEAFTELYSVRPDGKVGRRLEELLEIFQRFILDGQTHHFGLFFERDWKWLTRRVSFGHDIEGSWLLYRAAQVLGEEKRGPQTAAVSLEIAEAVLREGLDADGSVLYERDEKGRTNAEKHFWCQAEAVVGFLNACQLSGRQEYLEAAWRLWRFIEDYQIDRTYGEWFWKLDARRKPDLSMPKVSEWKCPYHNSRACMETIQRLEMILKERVLNGQTVR
ncbi:MAG TPA: AGE family epimerase/isomerase [Anaerohalosphaeraceae bacterium]|nr:AGE family epimerase/isomerase [Anaerohalosphaeraceae bacterium]HOL87951.1 AGE family epimerase/isomerase [Anaerohalosphaeraceae bacterium]HPP55450.1 AGE family epimerase/isomerase [Anaerohalosphaeraceae bacterium]